MSLRWQVRAVYADEDDRGVVGVLRADPVDWETGQVQRGGRVLGEIILREPYGYYWTSQDLKMSASAPSDTMKMAMRSLIEAEDAQGRLALDVLEPWNPAPREVWDDLTTTVTFRDPA